METLKKIKNLWDRADDWYENRWVQRHCPHLVADGEQAMREFHAGETISWEQLKKELQERYAAGGAVQHRNFKTRRA